MKKLIILPLIATFLIATSAMAADVGTQKLKNSIAELKYGYSVLAKEVKEGKITKDEAREQWEAQLAQFKAEKEKVFDEREEKIKKRKDEFLKKHPEKAAEIETKFTQMRQKREEFRGKRLEILRKVKSGDMTKEDARTARKEIVTEIHAFNKERQEKILEKIDERKDEFIKKHPEKAAEIETKIGAIKERMTGRFENKKIESIKKREEMKHNIINMRKESLRGKNGEGETSSQDWNSSRSNKTSKTS